MRYVNGTLLAIAGGAILAISIVLSDPGTGTGQDPVTETGAKEEENGGGPTLPRPSSAPVPVQVAGVALVECVNGSDVPLPVRFVGETPWYAGVTFDVLPGSPPPLVSLGRSRPGNNC